MATHDAAKKRINRARSHGWVLVAGLAIWLSVAFFGTFGPTTATQLFSGPIFGFFEGWSFSFPGRPEKLGELGDSFGMLNGLFGAITLWLVYRTYRGDRESSETQAEMSALQLDQAKFAADAQIALTRSERYMSEVAAASQSYNGLLHDIVAPDGPGARWEGRNGLWHWWKRYLIQPGVGVRPGWKDAPTKPLTPWNTVRRLYDDEQADTTLLGDAWVKEQVVSHCNLDELVKYARPSWRKLYAQNWFQLDALFRSWFHVYKTINSAERMQVPAEIEWAAAARFRAQLSGIELAYLLANLVFSEGPDGKGFPEAIKMCERYAVFDNFAPGLDPIQYACLFGARGLSERGFAPERYIELSAFESRAAKAAFRGGSP